MDWDNDAKNIIDDLMTGIQKKEESYSDYLKEVAPIKEEIDENILELYGHMKPILQKVEEYFGEEDVEDLRRHFSNIRGNNYDNLTESITEIHKMIKIINKIEGEKTASKRNIDNKDIKKAYKDTLGAKEEQANEY